MDVLIKKKVIGEENEKSNIKDERETLFCSITVHSARLINHNILVKEN